MKLKELIVKNGYTLDEYNRTVDMLVSKGVPNGVYQDYTLLMFVLSLLSNLEREVAEE